MYVIFLQGMVLSSVFLTLINLSRVVAKSLLQLSEPISDAIPIVIYGAGSAGQELSQAILMDKSKKLIAFYDDSKNLKDRSKNGIPIYGALENLKLLKKEKYCEMYEILEKTMLDNKNIHPNVDFPCGPTYYMMGIDIDFYTPIFVMSRITGWSAHIMEQHASNTVSYTHLTLPTKA